VSDLAARLRGLRAQAGAGQVPTVSTTNSVDAREQLRRLLGLRERQTPVPRPPAPVDRALPGDEIAPGLRYTEHWHAWLQPPAVIDASFARMGALQTDRLLCLDTETTGLAGGTGTRAFQIGVGDWCGERFRIRQLTLTTLSAETTLLRTFASWLAADTVLVSYNGKSYDVPLLATRYRLARLPNPLAGLAHLDLLHPMRRRYRAVWPNCRLLTAERQLLGIIRENDLPGSEAPRAWLQYLRGGSARDLRRVAEHNAQDLRSLAGLLLRLAESVDAAQ